MSPTSTHRSSLANPEEGERTRAVLRQSACEPTLVLLAAGVGRRFGGLKQLAPIGPNGEAILDLDDRGCGAGRIRRGRADHPPRDRGRDARATSRHAARVPVQWAFQDDLPPPSAEAVGDGTRAAECGAAVARFVRRGERRRLLRRGRDRGGVRVATHEPAPHAAACIVAYRLGDTLVRRGHASAAGSATSTGSGNSCGASSTCRSPAMTTA